MKEKETIIPTSIKTKKCPFDIIKCCALDFIKSRTINNKNNIIKNKTITTESESSQIIINDNDEYWEAPPSPPKSRNVHTPENKNRTKIHYNKSRTLSKSKSIQKNSKRKSQHSSKFDFSLFDIKNLEYKLSKQNKSNSNYSGPFLERMEQDVKRRQTREEKINKKLESFKPKYKEETRVKCFNRLICDSNKRQKIKERVENKENILSSGISPPQKMTQRRWNLIYKERFMKFKENNEENLRQKIIEKEKKNKQNEDMIVDIINQHTKKMKQEEIDHVINRLYFSATKKNINKKLNSLFNENNENEMNKNNNNNNDIKNDNNIKIIRNVHKHSNTYQLNPQNNVDNFLSPVLIRKKSTFENSNTHLNIKESWETNIKKCSSMEKIINNKNNKVTGGMNGGNFIDNIFKKSKEKKVNNNKEKRVNSCKKENDNKNKFVYKASIFSNKIAKNNFLKETNKNICQKNKKNKIMFSESTAMKIIEEVFVNKIKNK